MYHVPDEKRTKFESKSKSYVWNPETQRQTIVTDCVFDEGSFGEVMPEKAEVVPFDTTAMTRAVVPSREMAVVPSNPAVRADVPVFAVRPVVNVVNVASLMRPSESQMLNRSFLNSIEPTTVSEAIQSQQWQKWKLAIEEEWNCHGAWTVTENLGGTVQNT